MKRDPTKFRAVPEDFIINGKKVEQKVINPEE
jgi:hypothetical protein